MTSKNSPHYVSPDDLFVYPARYTGKARDEFVMGDGVGGPAWFTDPHAANEAFHVWNADRLTPATRGEVCFNGGSSYYIQLVY